MDKKIPQRKCLGCMISKNKGELIRIAKTSDGYIFCDETGKAEGRGAYICKSAQCLAKAIKAGRFARAFSSEIPREVYKRLEEEIEGE